MNDPEKERTRLLIEICTRSLSQMIAGAAIAQPKQIENGRKSLEDALCELAGVAERVARVV